VLFVAEDDDVVWPQTNARWLERRMRMMYLQYRSH